MFLISRKDFDNYLLQKALNSKSVTFFTEKVTDVLKEREGWILKTNKGSCAKVKFLIGADGCPSLIRKSVFKPIPAQFLAATVGYNFPCTNKYIDGTFEKNTVEAYYSREYVPKEGFIWIFPKRTSINVGIGSTENGKKLKKSIDNFLHFHPAGRRLKPLKGHFFSFSTCNMVKKIF
jgi:flavin-dependent dehydrogenase